MRYRGRSHVQDTLVRYDRTPDSELGCNGMTVSIDANPSRESPPMTDPSTSPTLLNLARAGNTQAWSRMVQIYGPLVYQWARGGGLQAADAADAMQETMVSVSRDLSKFDPQTASGKFRGWLWTITQRRIADLRRSRPDVALLGSSAARVEVSGEHTPLGDTPLGDSMPPGDPGRDDAGVLQRAVLAYRDRYDIKTWKAFWMTVVEGRDCGDVAADLGVTKWAVYKARTRILTRLRSELEGFL